MTKEELINNLRYTEKKHRNDIVNTFDTNISMMCSDVLKVLENCIEIPKGATNGDMIKAMFPRKCINVGFNERYGELWFYHNGKEIKFNKDWWNEPYKKEVEE